MKAALRVCLLCLAGSLCARAICAAGQTVAENVNPMLRGDSALILTVKDQTGAVVPMTAISIGQDATGLKLDGKTDGAGAYRLAEIASGRYSITAVARGFRREGFALRLGAGENLNWTVTLLLDPAMRGGGDGPEPIVEPIVSRANPERLPQPDTEELPMGGGPMPLIPVQSTPPRKPRSRSFRHFISTLGHKLGF